MSENEPQTTPGLSTGLKSMLIILGVILSIIIFLIWAGIIREAGDVAAGNSFNAPSQSAEDQVQAEPEAEDDRVGQAREPIIAMVDAPACESAENDAALLSEFVTVSEAEGGLASDDRQLIVDTLNKIDETCPKGFTLDLAGRLSGAGVVMELAEISTEADWVTKARPAPEDATQVTQFVTDSRNIHCTVESERVACSIYTYSFPSIPESCESYTQTFEVDKAGDADALCTWRLQADNQVGPGFYASDTFACEVKANSSVECWSQMSGKGFEVNRGGSRTF